MRNLPRILHWLPLLAGLVLPAALRAAESPAPFSPEQIHFFEKEIRPLLIERCQDCHGAHKHENGLRLDSRAAVVRGSDYGPVVVAGKPAESKLIHALHGQNGAEKMPKKGAPLSETQIAAMTRWIQEGLPWPAETEVAATEEKNDPHQHWAFLPVVKPAVPAMSPEAGKNEVDAFVGAKLQAAGLDFAEPATAADLCRRLHVTLTGLQPLPDRVRAFEKDFATDVDAAVAALVDELLASEHYGERWARHWLDVARYSDTEGYTAGGRDNRFPHAYTYRNWVINALNADMPYDQFVKNQLAADQLAPAEAVMQVSLAGAPLKPAPEVRNLAALGFLTVNDRFLGDRALQTDDRIDVVGRGLLGLTIGCARCHDHKYDPVSSVDYYALYGVFNSSEVPDETLMPVIGRPTDDGAVSEFQKKVSEVEGRMQAFRSEVLEDVRQPERLRDYLVFVQQNLNAESAAFRGAAGKAMMRDRFAERWRDFLKRFSATEKPHPVMFAWRKFSEIPAAEFDQKAPAILAAVKAAPEAECNRVVAEALTKREGGVHSLTDVADVYGRLFVEHLGDQPLADKQHESIRALMRGGVAPMQIEVGQADGFFTRKDRDKMTKMENEIKKLEIEDPGAPFRAMVMTDKAKPANQRVMIRGNPGRLGDAAPRAYPAFFGGQPFEHGSGRLELAERVASQDNPLTARVLVNRVWMHHFGKPLVSQPSDFGVQTPRPVQAELLDWLAARFMEEGWSIKKLHRHILNSRTYRQSSNVTPVKREKDADNALLSRMNRQRLDYESLRDGMLQVTGSLDLTRKPGRAVPLSAAEADQCRSIMLLVDRYEQPTVPAMFDFANPDSHTPERFVTTVPQQTLFLMNSPFMRQRADALAATLPVLGSTPDASTIQTLFERVLTRPASAEEVELAGRFLADATTMSAPRDHWEYGTFKLKLDEKAGSQPQFAEWIRFKTYEDKNHRWSPTGKVPDPQWSYAFLTNTTGHAAGSNLCPTARWQAPEDQTLHFRAEIKRPSEHGNGIRAWLVSDRQGVLTEASVAPNSTAVLTKSAVSVRAGEWISLVFDAIQGETSHDSFNWSLTVHQADNGQLLTDSKADFCGPNGRPIDGRLPPQSPLSQLSQVMLMSNAFQFVD